ncbi:MAG: M23 family metallopeptidase [Elusimicrobiota bacterium]|jgi:murein DD-endopeptidase MepM/ murein hydrolase activator NlpD
MRRRALLAAAFAALLSAGCSEAQRLGRKAIALTPEGRRALSEFDRYKKIARILKKYHDSKNLDEGEVLDVLVSAGVIPGAPGAARPPRPGAPAVPKTFPVPQYTGAWRWPMEAGVVSSEYGPRWGKFHHGLDLAADRGSPIYAAAPGEVAYAGDKLTGYGNVVFLRHDKEHVTIYAHNDALLVGVGDKVAQGQRIAKLGSTGHSTGPHLHFEMRVKDRSVPPRGELPKSRF